MANKNNKPAENKETKTVNNKPVINEEGDVLEEIKTQNLMRSDNVTKAIEKIKSRNDERQQEELIEAIQKTEYTNKKKRLDLRKRRAEEKITKESLVKSKQILDDLCESKITMVEAEDATKAAQKEEREAFQAINKEYDTAQRELRKLYPGYWRYEWDERW